LKNQKKIDEKMLRIRDMGPKLHSRLTGSHTSIQSA